MPGFAYLFIIIIGVVASFIHKAAQREAQTALKYYKKMSYDDAKLVAIKITAVSRHLYQNIWVINLLPSVRKIDRRVANLDVDDHKALRYSACNTFYFFPEKRIIGKDGWNAMQIHPTNSGLTLN